MTTYDPYDDDGARTEARAIAQQDQVQHRLRLLLDRRPPVFEEPGDLRTEIHKWLADYLAGDRGSLILIGEIGTGKTWSLWKTAAICAMCGMNRAYW